MKKLLLLLLFLPFIGVSQNWNQIGQDIDGETVGDESGRSVSMSSDGNIVAIGSPWNTNINNISGHVRVYENNGGTWVQIGQDIDGEALSDKSGYSVSLSADGSRVAIGAPENTGASGVGPGGGFSAKRGHVRIYEYDGSSWIQLGQDIDGEGGGNYSGRSISMSSDGNTVAIGAPGNDDNGISSGHVRVYNWDGVSWNQVGQDIDGEAAHDQSGYAVSLSSNGNILAVGARSNDGNGLNSGHVRLYNWDGVSWNQLGQDIDGEAADDMSGYSVSLSSNGTIVAIGATDNDDNGSNSGHVRLYNWNGVSWNQLGQDIDGEAAINDFGYSVSLSSDGSVVAIGGNRNSDNGYESGHVRVYNYDGNSWNQLGDDIDGEAAGDFSGTSVSISSDGNKVAIGAPQNDGNGNDAGHVRVYSTNTFGCTDSLALNYDPNATIDDGSCCYSSFGSVWNQKGQDLYDAGLGNPNDGRINNRTSISYNGNRIAISMTDSNNVEVMQWNGLSWQQFGNLIPFSNARRIAISGNGNIVAIADVNTFEIYEYSLGLWALTFSGGGITIDGPLALNYNGDNIVIGCDHEVKVFRKSINVWNIDFSWSVSTGGLSGMKVDIDSIGNTIVIGVAQGNTTSAGRLEVYNRISSNNWTQKGSNIYSTTNNYSFGNGVSISSDGNIVAGAGYGSYPIPLSSNNWPCGPSSNYNGHSEVYEYNGGNWTQVGSTICGGFNPQCSGDYITRVSISGDGSKLVTSSNIESCSPAKYYENISGNWTQMWSVPGYAKLNGSGNEIITESCSCTALGGTGPNGVAKVFYLSAPCASGCTDSLALNYDPNALTDDGSCIAVALGCTDSTALNYDPTALIDDSSCCNNSLWNQIGPDIDGDAIDDHFGDQQGVSLSDDGNILAISAPSNDAGGNNSGLVRIYERTNNNWIQIGQDIYGENANNWSGTSVSLSSDGVFVAIGANGANTSNGNGSGYVRVFENVNSNWIQVSQTINGEAAGDGSGVSVSISGNGMLVAIGAIGNDGNGSYSGHVRVYDNPSGNLWTQRGNDIDGTAADDLCGRSVSLNGDGTILAIGSDDANNNTGHVRVFEDINGSWYQLGQTLNGLSSSDDFGYSVSINNDGLTLVVGALGNDNNGPDAGQAYIYEYNSTAWIQKGQTLDGDGTGGTIFSEYFGQSVSISNDGNFVSISSPGDDANGTDAGNTRIFKYNPNPGGGWEQFGTDIDGEAIYDNSGRCVFLSGDASTLAIGTGYNDANGANSGHVRVFGLNSCSGCTDSTATNYDPSALLNNGICTYPPVYGCTDPTAINYDPSANTDDGSCCYSSFGSVWNQIGQDIDGNNQVDGLFGNSVSISTNGNFIAIGSPNETDYISGGQNSGVTRVYENINGIWTQLGQNIGAEGAFSDGGYSVSISDDGMYVATGEPTGTTSIGITGQVRVYNFNGTSWVQVGQDIVGDQLNEYFGYSVSLSSDGNILAIGAPYNDSSGPENGVVKIFEWNGINWVQKGQNRYGQFDGGLSGFSVSLSGQGNIVAIGAPNSDIGPTSDVGQVRMFYYDTVTYSWEQLGQDINGEDNYDESGFSVSMNNDGSIVAIGAHQNDGLLSGNSNTGHVRIYQYNGISWNQLGQDIDGEDYLNRSGVSVSLNNDGNLIAIGASENSDNGYQSGHTRIYRYDGNSWIQLGQDIDGESANDQSGLAVSLSGDGSKIAIGAPYNDGTALNAGHVRVYSINTPCSSGCTDSLALNYDANVLIDDGSCLYNVSGCTDPLANNYNPYATIDDSTCLYSPFIFGCTDSTSLNYNPLATVDDSSCCGNIGLLWNQIGQNIDGEAINDESGRSVSISSNGTIVAIGAPWNDGISSTTVNEGHVRIYEYNGSSWNQLGQDIDGEDDYYGSGFSVSLNSAGNIIAIGAPSNGASGGNILNSGHVRIYQYNGTSWVQLGQDIDGESFGSQSGKSVSLSSDGYTVAIGADYNDNANGNTSGHVRVYEWNGGLWQQKGQDIDGEAAVDLSGCSVSLSSDGNTVAIGAELNDGNGSNSGHVRIYEYNGTSWNQLGQDIDGEASGDQSGWSVSMSDDGAIVAIGAPWNSSPTSNQSGHVRVYNWDGSTWIQMGQDIDGEDNYDYLGAVSLNDNGNILAIGAYGYDGNGDPNINSGYVQVYEYDGILWNQIANDIEGNQYEHFGFSVSLSSNGDTVAIGAPYDLVGGAPTSGVDHVGIYTLSTPCSDLGCLDPLALNFDPNATASDSTCVYPVYGCIDTAAVNYNVSANIDDGSCTYCNISISTVFFQNNSNNLCNGAIIVGSTSASATYTWSNGVTGAYNLNLCTGIYVVTATDSFGCSVSDTFTIGQIIYGCTDSTALNYNLLATINDSSCVYCVYGCTDSIACNYNSSATCDDGSCLTVYGCTDSTATNYNPLATCDDNSCYYCDLTFNAPIIQAPSSNSACDGLIIVTASSTNTPISYSWNNGVSTNYNPLLCCGTYIVTATDVVGCSISDTFNICPIVYGCTDSTAMNYNPLATQDDGSCLYCVYGCTDSTAFNYNSLATCDDGSCCGNIGTIWNQIGQDIDGEAAGDVSGYSVSISDNGNIVAIGAPFNADNGHHSGHTRIYKNINGTWNQLGSDINGGLVNAESGWSVDLSSDGHIVAIGEPAYNFQGGEGMTRVFSWDGVSWNMLGDSIIGEGLGDQSGWSVSLNDNGNKLAIGAIHNDGNGGSSGHVRVYNWNGSSWVQIGQDIDGEASGDQFGNSVSISSSGDIVAIGASFNDGNGNDAGHVRVYNWNGSNWSQLGNDIDGDMADEYCGRSVSLNSDGNIVSIGSYKYDYTDGNSTFVNIGRVRVLLYDGSNWIQLGGDIIGESDSDHSGNSVSLSSDGYTLAIGAAHNDGNGNNAGHVRTYNYNGSSWSQVGIDLDGEATGDEFGKSVSISNGGTILAIGAKHNDGNGANSGHVRVYSINTPCSSGCTDSLALNYDPTALIDDSSCVYPVYGCTDSLSINYNSLANQDDGSCTYPVIYGCTDSTAVNYDPLANTDDGSCCYSSWGNVWNQIGQNIDGDYHTENSGYSVSLSLDGNIMAVGNPLAENIGATTQIGEVRVYMYDGGIWTQIGNDINGDQNGGTNSYFGASVSLSSDGYTLAIGAPQHYVQGMNSGHVRVYEFDGSQWNQMGQDIDGEAMDDRSGTSVSLSSNGNIVAIGAPENNGSQTNGTTADCGHVRVYEWDGSIWNQIGQDIDGENNTDNSGYSVSLSSDGNTVAIGAPYNDASYYPNTSENPGQVRIYNWDGTSWNQVGQDIDGEAIDDKSGWSVSLTGNGDIVAIGAPYNNGQDGHVRVYDFDGNLWNQIGQDIDSEGTDDLNGWSVSLSDDGNTVAIGAPNNSNSVPETGHVRVYNNINGNWNQIGQDLDGIYDQDEFGWSVSINGSGSKLAIGSPEYNHYNQSNSNPEGRVQVYSINTPCSSGCTDSLALNYDPTALIDDSTCIYPVYGCIDTAAVNYNVSANIDDGSCTYCNLTLNLADTIAGCDSVQVCTDSIVGGSYSWNSSNVLPTSPMLTIGDTYQGGIVFYLDGNGGGLIAAPSDQASNINQNGVQWGCPGTVTGANGTAIGTGQQNTIDIEAGCTTPGTAADTCANLTLGGYSDWYLPSKDELHQMYLNIGLGNVLGLGNVGGFDPSMSYWSSTEYDNDYAWWQNFDVTGMNGTTYKGFPESVRAIRSFTTNTDTTNCIWVSNSGWNYVTVTDSLGCTATDSVYVDITPCISGCTDSTAVNYDPLANTDDGSCTYCANDTTYTNITSCDSVLWNGNWYNTSGTYDTTFSISGPNINNMQSSGKEGNIWYFGEYAGLDFNSGSPVPLTDGQLMTLEGCASISDNNGDILFYTDGSVVYNKNHTVMPNGTGLWGHNSSSQSAIIVKKPGSSTTYYIFTVDGYTGWDQGLNYSEVDMSLDGGLGDITSNKNISLIQFAGEKVTAIRHDNGSDFWIVARPDYSNTFESFLLSSNGVDNTPIISNALSYQGATSGYLRSSQDGSKIAVCYAWFADELEVYDFDNLTGILSNPVASQDMHRFYGIEFSPDGNLLYATSWNHYSANGKVMQYDLNTSPLNAFVLATFGSSVDLGAIQLGPDNKLYVAEHSATDSIGVINDPNNVGISCNYAPNSVSLGGRTCRHGLPTFYNTIYTSSSSCDSTAILNLTINTPTSSTINDSACGSYTWNGQTYTTSGTYNWLDTNANGCDSTATLNLTINNGTTSIIVDSSCNEYIWNGSTYAASGTYTWIGTNAAGCDSTVTLYLTISIPTSSTSTVTSCDSYLWNGTTYTTSGNYTYVTVNSNGCDSTATLNLTINPPTTSTSSATSCDSYSWNGTTYTSTGVYTWLGSNSNGCDSTATLNLTINNSTISYDTVIACDSIVWIDGNTYTQSNAVATYTLIAGNSNGCDSTIILVLTINNCAVFGCTDSTALNFNPLANTNDGSCTYCNLSSVLPDTLIKCDSLFTIFSASGYSYLWNTGETTQNIIVDVGGTYNLTVTDSLGCTYTDSVYIHDYFHSFYVSDYTMGFEANEDISGWLIEDANNDGYTWNQSAITGVNMSGGMFYNYNINGTTPADDWLFSQCFVLDSSVTYDLSFFYRVAGPMFPENLSVYIGDAQSSTSMNTNLIVMNNITNSIYDSILINFSVPTSGIYYIGWKAHSDSNMWRIDLDNINIGINNDILGCTDSTAFNYNPFATIDDGSCVPFLYGCTDSTAFNYNPLANIDDGSCLPFLYGCTDPTAMNYYAAATVDDGSCMYPGCTDSTAINFDPTANYDDGSCIYISCGAITGVYVDNIIHDRATFNWDDMNSAVCVVDQIRIRYREVGTSAYSTKTMGAPVGNNAPCLNTSKRVLNLSASTQYEYDLKIWYQDGTVITWHAGGMFTTADPCLNATNVTVTPLNNVTKADFCWDAPALPWAFVRLKYRIDSAGTNFNNIGGMGVISPILCKEKSGITPGLDYRVMWRTWCSPTGGPYRSPQWDGPVLWTQPSSIRMDELSTISSLEVYPNPSRDIFNVTFTSDSKQSIEVRVVNLVGEIIFTENLENFEGEYTHPFNLSEYSKGVYLLEIDTDNGTVNKKLILQ